MTEFIQKDVPLASHTTLNIGGTAEFFCAVRTREELEYAVAWADEQQIPITTIGGGSNILVPDEGVRGLVIQIALTGITYEERGSDVSVHVGSGVVFDSLIEELVRKGLWGLENLSAIPGTVGGVPIQNVGAYGIEAEKVIQSVEVFDRERKEYRTLTNAECAFSYRDSYFKHEGKMKYIVTQVTFNVSSAPRPHIAYKDLALRFKENQTPSLQHIREAVCEIRKGKFPDWHVLGTAGSFFKNPIIDTATQELLSQRYPDMPVYKVSDTHHKVALGWVLDRLLNLKGFREGNVGLHVDQALVLVNYGNATAQEVLAFSDKVIAKVFDATGMRVEREVVVLK